MFNRNVCGARAAQWIEVLAQSQCVSQLAITHAVVMTVGMIARVCVCVRFQGIYSSLEKLFH